MTVPKGTGSKREVPGKTLPLKNAGDKRPGILDPSRLIDWLQGSKKN